MEELHEGPVFHIRTKGEEKKKGGSNGSVT
jgi:hypothetical protein